MSGPGAADRSGVVRWLGLPNIDPVQVLFLFAILLISLSVHEAAHAWSADRLGDDTARLLGRVSINPIVHVDLLGTIVLPLIAMFSGLPIIGWAKPVPVNPRNLGGGWRQKYMLIAAAGPASNLLIAILGAVIFRLSGGFESGAIGDRYSLVSVMGRAVDLNVLLAVFNMLPVPPLDGGNVLAGLLQGPVADAYDKLRPYGFIILYVLLLSGAFATLVYPISDRIVGWLL